MKDMRKRTLAAGDLVIVCVDPSSGQREIGIVSSMDKTATAPAKPAAMQAKLNGNFTFELTQDLEPANVKGNAAFFQGCDDRSALICIAPF